MSSQFTLWVSSELLELEVIAATSHNLDGALGKDIKIVIKENSWGIMKKLLITLVFAGFVSSCETMNDDPNDSEITNSMDFDKAYDLAVKHGKDTLKSFKKRVRHNREWRKLQKIFL